MNLEQLEMASKGCDGPTASNGDRVEGAGGGDEIERQEVLCGRRGDGGRCYAITK